MCQNYKKKTIVKRKSTNNSSKNFFTIKAFGPYKQPTNRDNTTLLMVTFRATLANERKNKVNSRSLLFAYEALHNNDNHIKTWSSLPNSFLNKVVCLFEKEKKKKKSPYN